MPDRRPTTDDRRPTTDDRRPTTDAASVRGHGTGTWGAFPRLSSVAAAAAASTACPPTMAPTRADGAGVCQALDLDFDVP
uniref:Uncharacterized protein n=1 Tax=Salinispora arenicola (strain CNS-205) TaxID=391037 RepID=A8LVU6_SALAI